ncbi:MAG: endonuclease III [Corynebacterium sp.]|nr:endonuclease III [Corynebacterium sp.]
MKDSSTVQSLDIPTAGLNYSAVEKTRLVNSQLADLYPDAHCELHFSNPLELTVATVLSAQTTDVRVNQVTPELFRRYSSAQDYATAKPSEIEQIIRPLGLAPSKAKRLVAMGEKLSAEFGGEIPTTIPELTSLPGVGRKTALVVRGNAFNIPGLAVDTHVKRVTARLGLSNASTERAIEEELCSYLPEEEWTQFSHRVIFHGRRQCTAKSPDCAHCPLLEICDYAGAEA